MTQEEFNRLNNAMINLRDIYTEVYPKDQAARDAGMYTEVYPEPQPVLETGMNVPNVNQVEPVKKTPARKVQVQTEPNIVAKQTVARTVPASVSSGSKAQAKPMSFLDFARAKQQRDPRLSAYNIMDADKNLPGRGIDW